ncbi:ankyrin repeat-containing domain protein [Terfezia claveryi]|nr:ankyrin repeat-containing domain protein [Terfezia claveryi]
MGDPLSIAASVAGLITISAQIVGMANELFDKVKDAPETMMRVREEVESMQPIFCQVQLLLNGSGSGLNRGNLTMISVHNLMTALTGCVIVYTRLEKKVNEVCGFSDPTTASTAWKRAGVIADRVKWGLWRQEEVLVIMEDLQRQKRTLNLMLTIITCTTTTEASGDQERISRAQERLQDLCLEILQSNHAHSVLLRDLISRQDEQARILEEFRDRDRSNTSTLRGTGSSTASTSQSSAGSCPSDYRNNSDNASIMSKRSTLSFRFRRPDYMEDLKASRAYKRLRYFGLGTDSSSDSVLSFDSGCSTGNWSMLSDITLGDLSVSQIAVLNLPIDITDVSNPEPFQLQLSMETLHHPKSRVRSKRSSRGRIHNAIENGNVFVVRTLLAMGMDSEELDSNGRTPLVHAIMKHQETICKLLLEKGACASVDVLKNFTSGTDLKERSELIDPLITRSLDDGTSSVYVLVLRLLVQMALGTNYGGDFNQYSGQSMLNLAIDMNYELAVRAIIQLEPQVLVEVDTEGRTPFAYAYHLQRNRICEMLLQNPEVDMETATEAVKLEGGFTERVHAVIEEKCPLLLRLQLLFATSMDVNKIGTEGQTSLTHAAEVVLNSEDINYEHWNDAFKALLSKASRENIEALKKLTPRLTAPKWIASMHELIQKDYRSILVLLSFTELRDTRGWTSLALAAIHNREGLCQFLLENGCTLCLNAEQKEQLKPNLSYNIHVGAKCGHKTVLQLLLDMGADINERNSCGETALLEAVYYNHLSCVKILIGEGADATISTHGGENVLHRAAQLADSEMMRFLLDDVVGTRADSEMMRFLLDDVVGTRNLVNMKDSAGNTPLHVCSYMCHQSPVVQIEIAKMLVQAGASLTIRDKHQRTPCERAWSQGQNELAEYLYSQLAAKQQEQENFGTGFDDILAGVEAVALGAEVQSSGARGLGALT